MTPWWGNPGYFFRNVASRQPRKDMRRPNCAAACLDRTRLRALLLPVALFYFAFCGQPVLGLAARRGSALLVEFIGAAPDFVFQIDGNEVGSRTVVPGFAPDYFHLPGFGRLFDFCRCDFRGRGRSHDCLHFGQTAVIGLVLSWICTICLAARGRFRPCHNWILLTYT